MSKRNIPVFHEDFAFGVRLYSNEPCNTFYPCPVTENNILDQEHPDELLVYYDNLDGQVTHLNERYQHIYDAFQQEEDSSDYDFINYLVDQLPEDKPLFHLVISHPDGVGSDFVELLYEGVYERDWVPVNDDDVEEEDDDAEFVNEPLKPNTTIETAPTEPSLTRDDVVRIIQESGGSYHANFKNANLDGADLHELDLSGANFIGARFEGAILNNTNFENAQLHHAILTDTDCTGANFKSAGMAGCNLSDSRLDYANFDSADLCCAVLLNCSMKGALIKSTYLEGLIISHETLADTVLVDSDTSYITFI
jgi:uncharacterized protein YjbI with pentapeptide repeats